MPECSSVSGWSWTVYKLSLYICILSKAGGFSIAFSVVKCKSAPLSWNISLILCNYWLCLCLIVSHHLAEVPHRLFNRSDSDSLDMELQPDPQIWPQVSNHWLFCRQWVRSLLFVSRESTCFPTIFGTYLCSPSRMLMAPEFEDGSDIIPRLTYWRKRELLHAEKPATSQVTQKIFLVQGSIAHIKTEKQPALRNIPECFRLKQPSSATRSLLSVWRSK